MDHLVDRGVKMLVIACNSASAAVLRDARERYRVPVVEVIQPAVRRAVRATRNGRVGVIGTQATIDQSGAYDDAFAAAPHLRLTSRPARGSWSSSRRGSPAGPELLRRGPRVPRAAARAAGRRHPRARAAPTTRC